MTKSFAAIVFTAVALLAATSAHACSDPNDALLADPALTQTETNAQQAANKDRWPTEQGGKTDPGGN